LLALGFGEAGAQIIAENMSRGGDIDPMLPGKKIMAIFGFCDIRNFADCTGKSINFNLNRGFINRCTFIC